MAKVSIDSAVADRRPAPPNRPRARAVLAVALSIGLAAGLVSYFASSLSLADPVRAGTAELRERGAAGFFEFCAVPKFEPRFWPECIGGADDWRERGADRLVAFCTEGEPSRFFHFRDCISEEQPLVSLQLSGGPRPQDALVGLVAAAVAAVAFVAWTALRPARLARPPG